MQPFGTESIRQPLITKKITQPLGTKKITQPLREIFVLQLLQTTKSHNLLGHNTNYATSQDQKKTRNLSGQQKIKHTLGQKTHPNWSKIFQKGLT